MQKSISLLVAAIIIGFTSLSVKTYAQNRNNDYEVVQLDNRTKNKCVPNQLIVKFRDGAGVRRSETKSTRFKFLNNTKAENSVNSILDKYNVEAIECLGKEQTAKTKAGYWKARSVKSSNGKEVWDKDISQMFLITLDAKSVQSQTQNHLALIEELKKDENIEFAEPNYIQYALGTEDKTAKTDSRIPYYNIGKDNLIGDNLSDGKYWKQNASDKTSVKSYTEGTPNDPMYSQQYGLTSTHMPELWKKPKLEGAKRKVIAIVDTGVDVDHPDLKDNIWNNPKEVSGMEGEDDDNNGFVDDIHGWDFVNQTGDMHDFNGHGTHCAGIAAAVGDNGIGVIGANPDALIMAVTVFQSGGSGDVATIIKGINYAAENGADIISMSFGGYAYSIAEEQALAHAYQTAVLVAAAGNDGRAIDVRCCFGCEPPPAPMFPGAFTFVFGVRASDNYGMTFWSNWDCDGVTFSQYSEEQLYNYEVLAPGQYILSTIPGGEYAYFNGTSMSTPLVAGGISALMDRREYKTNEILFSDIIQTCGEKIINFDSVYLADTVISAKFQAVAIDIQDTLYGNNNGIIEAGETIDIYPTVRNIGGVTDSVEVWIETAEYEDSTILSFTQNHIILGHTMSAYSTAKTSAPIICKIDSNVVDGRTIRINLRATSPSAKDTLKKEYTIRVSNCIILKGFTNGNMTLEPNYQYVVEQFFAVPAGDTLFVKPGTTVKLRDGASISVADGGYMYAHGTADSMITFTKTDLGGEWYRLYGKISLKYCRVEWMNNMMYDSENRFVIDSADNCIFMNNNMSVMGRYRYCNIIGNKNDFGAAGYTDGYWRCGFGQTDAYGDTNTQHFTDRYNNHINNYTQGADYTQTWLKKFNSNVNIINVWHENWNDTYTNEFYFRDEHDVPTYVTDFFQDSLYLGSSKESIYRQHLFDAYYPGDVPSGLNRSFGVFDVSKVMPHPVWEAHGMVWKVEVNGYDAQDEFDSIPPLGVGTHEFKIYFNRAMDTSVAPYVAMGVRPPYTQTAISNNGSWSEDSTVYTVYVTLTGKDAIDGLNRIYVDGAKDNEHFEIPFENRRFNVYVESSGSMSAGFQATAGIGRVELEWNDQEMNFDDFLGFNMYRYKYDSVLEWRYEYDNEKKDWVYWYDTVYKVVDTVQINTSLIVDTLFTDYDVVPGERYYYYYKVLRTSLEENSPSKTVSSVPLSSTLGDANGSFTVDVADIITVINYITNKNPKLFIFEAADVNGDGIINILDVVGIVNIIMGHNSSKKSENDITALYSIENDTLFVDSPVPMAGVQFTFTNDKIQTLESLSQFEQVKQWTSDTSYMFMAYSMSGKQIPAGKKALIKLNGADMTDIILSDTDGKNIIPIKADQAGLTDVVSLQSAIMQAYPNPSKDDFTVTFAVGDKKIKTATLTFTDITGRVLTEKEFNINSTGEYSYKWNAGNLQNGMYFVQLRVDGVLAHTKKLIVNK
ncbi:MAG: S8 family serine peptidase [Bacteroidales bacterium]|nr:S8 family serine peptidase [Bacteroidales bacterium]